MGGEPLLLASISLFTGIVFDTHECISNITHFCSLCLMGIVFDTYECGINSLSLWAVLYLPGIVFDTHERRVPTSPIFAPSV